MHSSADRWAVGLIEFPSSCWNMLKMIWRAFEMYERSHNTKSATCGFLLGLCFQPSAFLCSLTVPECDSAAFVCTSRSPFASSIVRSLNQRFFPFSSSHREQLGHSWGKWSTFTLCECNTKVLPLSPHSSGASPNAAWTESHPNCGLTRALSKMSHSVIENMLFAIDFFFPSYIYIYPCMLIKYCKKQCMQAYIWWHLSVVVDVCATCILCTLVNHRRNKCVSLKPGD